jgi:hypothetical protein
VVAGMNRKHADPIYEYDQWVRRYEWKKRNVERIGYVLAGFALALIVYAFIVLASAVLG